jgi:membrane associated rhomboid family serine protease
MHSEKGKFIAAVTIPGILLILMWLLKVAETIIGFSTVKYGIHPLHLDGLQGIVLAPLIHSGFKHLAANSLAFVVLGTGLFYFYRQIALKSFIAIWILSGIWVWFGGRDSYHIGASGVIYGMAAFLFVSGLIRKDTGLAALTLIVTFLYGSLIWGAIPGFLPDKQISWEAHLGGMVSGIIMAVYYRKSGPERKKYQWEIEEELEQQREKEYLNSNFDYWNNSNNT